MTLKQVDRLAALVMPAARAAALMALDRASVREVSAEGHMAISVANLSAAGVSIYRAEEVPGWQSLGLRPGQVVRLLRPPEELAKAAPTLCGKPVLLVHKPVSAEDHPHRLVVGSVGNDVRFEDPWLRGSLTVWSGEAIEAVKDGSQRDLSCGYAYVPRMQGGSYQGARYDGVMSQLKFNHLAIVPEGRVPGCIVGDAAIKLKGSTMPARPPGLKARDDDPEVDPGIRSQLLSYLGDVLLPEQIADVETILNGGTVAAPSMAGDAAARRVARQVVAAHREKQGRDLLRRFPGADRLGR